MKKIIFMLSFLFLFSINVNAIEVPACTTSELNRLRELANNVNFQKKVGFKVDEVFELVDAQYNIEIVNFDDDLQISYQTEDDDEPIMLKPGDKIDDIFYENETVKFQIYAYTVNLCTGKLLKTISVKMPYYNDYYYFNQDKCNQYPEFKYCKENMKTPDISFEKIDKEFEKYINSGNISNISKKDNKIHWEFILIGGAVVVLIGVGVFFIVRYKKEKSDI